MSVSGPSEPVRGFLVSSCGADEGPAVSPHPRIRKSMNWTGAVLSAILLIAWIGSGWVWIGGEWPGPVAMTRWCSITIGRLNFGERETPSFKSDDQSLILRLPHYG